MVARASTWRYADSVTSAPFTIVGRSSSTFTRVTRIFAAELGVPCALEVVRDLRALEASEYGGNPALKVPSLRTPEATWFGALNACRALARASQQKLRIVWPEALDQPLLGNMQELVLQAMSTEVGLIMSGISDGSAETVHRAKLSKSLNNVILWLDEHVRAGLAALPVERDLSYLEVTLFCLITHLDFRSVMTMAPYRELAVFSRHFGARAACLETEFRFDS